MGIHGGIVVCEVDPDAIGRLMAARLAMFEGGRSCLELAQQLQAVESAVHAAKRALIQDHMAHCIAASLATGGVETDAALREFKALAKYL